jgi:hypothetical protein
MPPITKAMVVDASAIGAAIQASGLTTMGGISKSISTIYQSKVMPSLNSYESQYGKRPNRLLKGFLEDYNNKIFGGQYFVSGHPYWGRKVYAFEWAVITKRPAVVDMAYRDYQLSPQLILLVGEEGISAGLSYGVGIKDSMACVQKVMTDAKIQTDMLNVVKKSKDWLIVPNFTDPSTHGSTLQYPVISSLADITNNWYDQPRLVKFFKKNNITNNINTELNDALDNVAPIFKQL